MSPQWKPYFDALIMVVLIFAAIAYGYRIGRKSAKGEPLVEMPKRRPGSKEEQPDPFDEAYITEGDL